MTPPQNPEKKNLDDLLMDYRNNTDCLVTLNTNRFLQGWVRDRFIESSQRWGVDFCEVHCPENKYSPSIAKFIIPSNLSGYRRIAYFDADCVIDNSAPNPLELCKEQNTIYAVSDYYGANCCNEWIEGPYKIGIETSLMADGSLKAPPYESFFNAGMWMCYVSGEITNMFRMASSLLPVQASLFMEQGAINMAAYNSPGISVSLIPRTWNRMIPPGGSPSSEFYVNHYGGGAHELLKQMNL